jgi:hypothetical protein
VEGILRIEQSTRSENRVLGATKESFKRRKRVLRKEREHRGIKESIERSKRALREEREHKKIKNSSFLIYSFSCATFLPLLFYLN